MPLLVEYFWSHISQTACQGRERLSRGMDVLSTARTHDTCVRCVSSEQIKAIHARETCGGGDRLNLYWNNGTGTLVIFTSAFVVGRAFVFVSALVFTCVIAIISTFVFPSMGTWTTRVRDDAAMPVGKAQVKIGRGRMEI